MLLTSFDRRENAAFLAALRRLEATTSCQGLTLQSFLTLPMQRITRLPLLVDAACHRMDSASVDYQQATLCLHTIQKVRTPLQAHHRVAQRSIVSIRCAFSLLSSSNCIAIRCDVILKVARSV